MCVGGDNVNPSISQHALGPLFPPGPKPPNREPAVTCIQVPDSIRRHSSSSLRSAHDIRSGWVRIETYPAASKSKKGRHSGGGNGAADRRARIDSLMARASPDLNLPTRSAATWATHPGTRRQSMPAESSSNCSDCTRRRVSGPELSYMLGLMCGVHAITLKPSAPDMRAIFNEVCRSGEPSSIPGMTWQ